MNPVVITITAMLMSIVAFLVPLVRQLDLPGPSLVLLSGVAAWYASRNIIRGRPG